VIRTPPAVFCCSAPDRRTSALVEVSAELVDERGRIQRLADRGVVNLAVLLEVLGEVGLGVAPAP